MCLYPVKTKVFQFYDNPRTSINSSQYQMIMSNYHLMASSASFLGPALYGAYKGNRLLPLTSLLTSAVSIYYWKYPHSLRLRALDLIVSKSCGLLYFIYGYYTVPIGPKRIVGYMNLFLILCSYQALRSLHSYNNPWWKYAHILFHGFSSFGQFVVVH